MEDLDLRDAVNRWQIPGPRILTSLGQISNKNPSPDSLRAHRSQLQASWRRRHQAVRFRRLAERRRADAVRRTARRDLRRGKGARAAHRRARDQRGQRSRGDARRLHGDRARHVRHRRRAQADGGARHDLRSAGLPRVSELHRPSRGLRQVGLHRGDVQVTRRCDRLPATAMFKRALVDAGIEDHLRHRRGRARARTQRRRAVLPRGGRAEADGRDHDGDVGDGERRSASAIISARSRRATMRTSSRCAAIRRRTSTR